MFRQAVSPPKPVAEIEEMLAKTTISAIEPKVDEAFEEDASECPVETASENSQGLYVSPKKVESLSETHQEDANEAPTKTKTSHLLNVTPKKGHAFTEALSEEALAFFNELTQKTFSEQAIAFLNAYWKEVGDQAEFIFTLAWETIKYADMHTKGVNYIHLYNEGNDLDFNIGLYFYEKLCKKVLEDDAGKPFRQDPKYATSMPTMMTAIVRKKELREKVDVNFDGRVSFLEYLLYQYKDEANPSDFTHRAMKHDVDEHPAITKARKALQDVNDAIRKYEAEKQRLEELAAKPGVKGLGAKHQLAILHASPLADKLNVSLITAEAAVRMATKKFAHGAKRTETGDGTSVTETDEYMKPTDGSIWWLNRDLKAKKELYGR